MIKELITPLSNTYFNLTANNFTMLLNRREVERKINFKSVKELKKNNRYVNSLEEKTITRTCRLGLANAKIIF